LKAGGKDFLGKEKRAATSVYVFMLKWVLAFMLVRRKLPQKAVDHQNILASFARKPPQNCSAKRRLVLL